METQDSLIRPIPGHNSYGVTSCGLIFSRAARGSSKVKMKSQWSPINPSPCSFGRYKQFSVLGGRKMMVHRAVFLAFHGSIPHGCQVAHINGNSHDNRIENLTAATPVENNRHKRDHGTHLFGSRSPAARLTEANVRAIQRAQQKLIPGWILAAYFNVSQATISNILRRKVWKHMHSDAA